MLLGIEIGGTKLQLAVAARPGADFIELRRETIDAACGATGILDRIASLAPELVQRHGVVGAGIGFGGPINAQTGVALKSHHVHGWDDFPLADWLTRQCQCPVRADNDCNVAALAEARYGAGAGRRRLLYVTVGTGVGGGLVVDGQLFGGDRPAICEIGHLRPSLQSDRPEMTVEAIASGWGIAAEAQDRVSGDVAATFKPATDADSPAPAATYRK
jgi:glucokinase